MVNFDEIDVDQGISLMLKLLDLGMAAARADSRVLELIRGAQEEGRELTDEEIAEFAEDWDESFARWNDLMEDVPEE